MPGLAAELGKRGRLPVYADVPRHLSNLLVRDVEAVVSAEAEEQVVARHLGDLAGLETEELADAVILVDDVVARAQLGERLQRAADGGRGAAREPLAEDLGVGEQDDPQVAPDEAAPGRADCEEDLGLGWELLVGLDDPRLGPAEHSFGAERFAAVREGHEDALPRANEGAELVLGLGQAAGGDGRSLRLEREGLARRQGVELGDALQDRELPAELFLPDLAHRIGLPDEIGPARHDRNQVGGSRRKLAVVEQPRLDEIGAALGGGIDKRSVDGVKSSLRERREGPDPFDLVAEELDA